MYLPHVGLVRIPAIGWAAWVLASAPGLVAAQVPDLGSGVYFLTISDEYSNTATKLTINK